MGDARIIATGADRSKPVRRERTSCGRAIAGPRVETRPSIELPNGQTAHLPLMHQLVCGTAVAIPTCRESPAHTVAPGRFLGNNLDPLLRRCRMRWMLY